MSAAGFVVAAIAMLACLLPAGIVLVRGELTESVVGYEFVTGVAVMVFALLAEGFGRPSLFEFPVLLAVLLYGSGLVFARALQGRL
jgi:multisubunit Na+/H+ antiporter MnhF subunit